MSLSKAINKFYFNLTIGELRFMNNFSYPNITYNSLLYLDVISYKENCTVSFLADAMNVSKSAVTIKINELISKGLVVKRQSLEDKRINYLSINDKLKHEYDDCDKRLDLGINALENKYTKDELELFSRMLETYGDAINQKN